MSPIAEFVWIDTETTGLQTDPNTFVVEVGARLTDRWGQELFDEEGYQPFQSLVVYPHMIRPNYTQLEMFIKDEFVLDMHSKNGLLDEYNIILSTPGVEPAKYFPGSV